MLTSPKLSVPDQKERASASTRLSAGAFEGSARPRARRGARLGFFATGRFSEALGTLALRRAATRAHLGQAALERPLERCHVCGWLGLACARHALTSCLAFDQCPYALVVVLHELRRVEITS